MPGTPFIEKKNPKANAFKGPMARSRGGDVYIQKLQLLVVSHVKGIHISMLRAPIVPRDNALCWEPGVRRSRGMGISAWLQGCL